MPLFTAAWDKKTTELNTFQLLVKWDGGALSYRNTFCVTLSLLWDKIISKKKKRHCSMFVWVCNSSHTQLTSVLSVICYVVVLWPEPWLQMESDHCLWGCKRMYAELNLLFWDSKSCNHNSNCPDTIHKLQAWSMWSIGFMALPML